MIILGEEKDYDAVVDGYAGIEKDIRRNMFSYRELWEGFLPHSNGGERKKWQMAYNPLVCMAPQYFDEPEKPIGQLGYFVYVINLGRDSRPHTADKKEKTGIHKQDCPVCINNLTPGMILTNFGNFTFTPNKFPYHNYSSLLVSKDVSKKQDTPTVEDIQTFMRFSILTGQSVFYNTFNAGATIEHQHAQVVDPEEIKSKGKTLAYPLFRAKREKIARGIERVVDYAIDSVVFDGRDAPFRTYELYNNLLRKGHKYNFLISGRKIFVFGRNPYKEKSPCIEKCVGTYELMGVVQLGNVYERKPDGGEAKLITDATELFRSIPPERIAENLEYACVGLDSFIKHYGRKSA